MLPRTQQANLPELLEGELPRIRCRRSSQNSPSKYFGELLEVPLLDHFFKGGLTLVLPLSAHPVSPSAIQLGMDESLWILNAHRTLEEPVEDDHQDHYQNSANEARRKWVCHRQKRRHPKGV